MATHTPPGADASSLQTRLDEITARTRSLVQPERIAITDAMVSELLASGIEGRVLRAGAMMPAFALADAKTGKLVNSTDLLKFGPLVINFFRGRWCPYCMTELEAWQEEYAAVRGRGALLVGISPQLPRQNEFCAQQHEITFPVLSDPGCKVAEQFGLVYSVAEEMQQHFRSILVNIPFLNGETSWTLPLPGTFVVGQDGRIRFAEAFAEHRTRPDLDDVLAAL